MMGEVSQQDIDEYVRRLDVVWMDAQQVIAAPFTTFDKSFGVAQSIRSIKKMEIAQRLTYLLDELLKLPVHLGSEQTRDLAIQLENVMVTNIARVTRLDADTGIQYRRIFLEYNRSGLATIKVYLRTFWSHIGFTMDDGVRGGV